MIQGDLLDSLRLQRPKQSGGRPQKCNSDRPPGVRAEQQQSWEKHQVRGLACDTQGRILLPNRINFWKNSKRPLTPSPHF